MVYFILSKEDNLVKIGYSNNPQRRLKQLISEHKKSLELYSLTDGDLKVEKYFHDKHIDYNVKGEWFKSELLLLCDYNVCYDNDLMKKSKEKKPSKLRPVYLTDDKYEEVCKKAKKKGMDFSNYVKSRI